MWPEWLWRSDDLGQIHPWNPVIADRCAADTERLLLGWAGPPRVVGNRRDEAIVAEREQRAAAMTRRQADRERWRQRKVG